MLLTDSTDVGWRSIADHTSLRCRTAQIVGWRVVSCSLEPQGLLQVFKRQYSCARGLAGRCVRAGVTVRERRKIGRAGEEGGLFGDMGRAKQTIGQMARTLLRHLNQEQLFTLFRLGDMCRDERVLQSYHLSSPSISSFHRTIKNAKLTMNVSKFGLHH
jgi:hypothetical protein